VVVAKDGSGDYTTIEAALENTDPDDIVRVKAGVYNESGLEPRHVTIIGEGQNATILDLKGEWTTAFVLHHDWQRGGEILIIA